MNSNASRSGAQARTCMLLKLSTELLQIVAQHCVDLPDESLLNLRATCRDIEYRTRSFWRHTYFRWRNVTLELDKLNQLCDVCSRFDLANEVKGLFVRCADDGKVNLAREGKGVPFQRRNDLLRRAFKELRRVNVILFADMNENVLESTDRKMPDDGRPAIDFSLTFATVLSIAEQCDLPLTGISTGPSDHESEPFFGIVMPSGLADAPNCLSRITDLELHLLYETDLVGSAYNADSVSKEFGIGMSHLKSLKRLRLVFDGFDYIDQIVSSIGSALSSARLQGLALIGAACEVQSLGTFLRPHAGTLRSFELVNTEIGSFVHGIEDFRHLLENLHDSFNLTRLLLSSNITPNYCIGFQGMGSVSIGQEANEDDFVEICMDSSTVELEGDDLKGDISRALRCLTANSFT